jgi:hypothetical protein
MPAIGLNKNWHRSLSLLAVLFALQLCVPAQTITEKDAKNAVRMITQHSGLSPNFVVRENLEVKTAIAFIKSRKRYIEYNPDIISGIVDSSHTDWAAVSILAHEIAHHFLGHTLDPTRISPGDELACDKYSGFILQRMGATEEEAVAAITIAGTTKATSSHPPRQARIEAISQGWQESVELADMTAHQARPQMSDDHFSYKLRFEGDENLYYITDGNEVVWYDNYADPIILGKFVTSDSRSYLFEIVWEGNRFYIDHAGKVWNLTAYNVMMQVGDTETIR